MKTATTVCGKCGAKIPDDTTRKVCPACLLETGLGLLPDEAPTRAAAMLVKFGDFEIARREDGSSWELGRGGMGVTYRARDYVLHRSVALKVIEVPSGAVNSEAVRERFLREARAAAALRHPNVAAVYHFGTVPEPDRCYYAMELVEGETLEARVRREGPLKVAQVLEIGVQVTRALIAAANQGLIHRDLKPANIMLTRSEDSSAGFEVKVIDFGLAKVTAESFGEMDLTHGGFVGTPSYASPEQFAGSRVDARSDIYSLGASLWFALTGRLPCAGTNVDEIRRCQTEAPLPVQQLVTRKVPALVIGLLRSMLAIDPDERPASGRELMEALENCRSKLTGGDETARRSFFAELKRRNVYKVAIAYGVVAWLLMQVASQIFPFFEIPSWAVRLVVLALIIGFPVAVILAWAFELTPEGIKREEDVDLGSSITRKTGRKLDFFIIAVLVLVIGLLLFQRFHQNVQPAVSSSLEKSIAVLPFENLSRDPDNAYFAEGIQEEILTRLAKIAELKVISRTSTQRYQSKPRNLSEIAKQLGVANILEGSVQKASDQVRVNVQLVNAQTDAHLWAESYDRKLTDIFGVESEIAKGIAEALQAKLTGREEQSLAVKPTNNPEAYDAYLRGVAFDSRSTYSPGAINTAIDSYERAVQLDPNFALAWARLSRAYGILYLWRDDNTAVRRDAAKRAFENAQRLQPNSPETLLALGYYQYLVLRDYGSAKTTFGLVSKMLPGSSEVPMALGRIARREGHWDENIPYFERALALDPRNVELLMEAAGTYADLRQFPAALKLYDRVLDITPNDPDMIAAKANMYQAKGRMEQAARFLSEINAQTPNYNSFRIKINQLRLERNLGEAIRLLQARQAQFHFASDNVGNQVMLACTQRLNGDIAGAKVTAEQARNALEPLCKNQPDDPDFAALLSLAHAALGEKNSALKEAERAIMLLPRAQDALDGPYFEENLALIQTMVGEKSRAISTLTRLLQTPYAQWIYVRTPVTPALLRLDPIWDPLRADPAFQKLCEEKQPVAPEVLTQSAPEKSIAVLPFENLSEEKANAYFADGIQEEILTRLAKIADLKVISRTSTQKYKSSPDNLREIAQQLGVANILEGSVQKAADKVRVNVQLINAQTDSHLWAETYDRKLTDIFGVESEIAKGIAEQLRAKLTGQEEQVISAKPTDNPEAYDAYLRGLAYTLKTATTPANILAAQKYLREAVRLDPKFALSWALLSYVDALGYVTAALQRTITLREEARQAAETALTLQPNLGEAVLAKGYYHHACLKDYDTAVRYFEQARQLLPNSSRIPESLAYVARRRGQWDRSESFFNEAERLDPRSVSILTGRAANYICLRRFPEAMRKLDQVLNIVPDDVDTLVEKAGIAQSEGDLPRASAILAALHPNADDTFALETQVYQAILERRPAQIIARLKEILAKPDPALGYFNGELRFYLGWAQDVAGDHAAAQESWRQARRELESVLKEQPDNYTLIGDLALTKAGLGDKAAALALAERAMAAVPIEKDALVGPASVEVLARVAAQTGEADRAIAALQKLLSIPYDGPLGPGAPLTPALLRLDPMFDPLRNDPRFQKLCEEKQP